MQAISRDEAKRLGLKRFYTGVSCRNGHASERFCGNGQCVACRSEKYDKDWAKAYNDAYRENNKSQLVEYDRKRYLANPEVKKKSSRDYYHANRDQCIRHAKLWREGNPDRAKQNRRAYREKNSDRLSAIETLWRAENRAAIVARVREWRARNPGMKQAQHAKRRAGKRLAIPMWFSDLDEFVWREAMHLTQLRREATGIDWAADHMIPLASKLACGLHVAANCQVIPSYLNNRKHNKLIMTEPFEWISHL